MRGEAFGIMKDRPQGGSAQRPERRVEQRELPALEAGTVKLGAVGSGGPVSFLLKLRIAVLISITLARHGNPSR